MRQQNAGYAQPKADLLPRHLLCTPDALHEGRPLRLGHGLAQGLQQLPQSFGGGPLPCLAHPHQFWHPHISQVVVQPCSRVLVRGQEDVVLQEGCGVPDLLQVPAAAEPSFCLVLPPEHCCSAQYGGRS